MSETKKMVEYVDVCISCGNVFVDADDYDTLGSKDGICCPDCGTEKFVSVQTIIKQRDDLLTACKAQEKADKWFGPSDTGHKLKETARKLSFAAIAKCDS